VANTDHLINSGHTVDVNPATAVSRQAALQPDSVVICYPGGDLTYAELDGRAARLAAVLAAGGTREGERVAYLGLNSPAFLITLLAAHRLGALFVPLNFRLAAAELQRLFQLSGATAVVAEEGHREIVDGVRSATTLRRFLLVDDDPEVPAAVEEAAGWEPWSTALADATPVPDVVPRTFDDPAMLMFTSGTTGEPKGVVLTHGNVWWNSVNVDSRLDTRRGDVTYIAAPLFHIGALNSFGLRTLARGGTLVVRRGFDPACMLEDLSKHGVNSMFAVPMMLAAVRRVPGVFDRDFSSLRAVVVAGAPVPPSLIEDFAAHGVWLEQAWGLTETAPFATHLPREWTTTKLGSAGVPMPHTEVRVVEPGTSEPVGAGVAGELLVRGPNVTPGYWENPVATAAAFDAEGWFHSGDIGYLDDDSCLFIVDRLKDMITTGGENVYPAEVERALADMPEVLDVAVVGAPDPQWGETVVAVVSVAPGATITLEDVREHAAERLARYKLPRRLKVVESIPRNPSGKLVKPVIRAWVSEGDPS
jgi:fatty-acyl-CoA synthase